jgi:hypothetical protein
MFVFSYLSVMVTCAFIYESNDLSTRLHEGVGPLPVELIRPDFGSKEDLVRAYLEQHMRRRQERVLGASNRNIRPAASSRSSSRFRRPPNQVAGG